MLLQYNIGKMQRLALFSEARIVQMTTSL